MKHVRIRPLILDAIHCAGHGDGLIYRSSKEGSIT